MHNQLESQYHSSNTCTLSNGAKFARQPAQSLLAGMSTAWPSYKLLVTVNSICRHVRAPPIPQTSKHACRQTAAARPLNQCRKLQLLQNTTNGPPTGPTPCRWVKLSTTWAMYPRITAAASAPLTLEQHSYLHTHDMGCVQPKASGRSTPLH